MATRETREVGYDHAARHRFGCGCEVVGLWRRLFRDDPSGRSIAVAVPDGWRIVAACSEHSTLEGASYTLDDGPFPGLLPATGSRPAREAR